MKIPKALKFVFDYLSGVHYNNYEGILRLRISSCSFNECSLYSVVFCFYFSLSPKDKSSKRMSRSRHVITEKIVANIEYNIYLFYLIAKATSLFHGTSVFLLCARYVIIKEFEC